MLVSTFIYGKLETFNVEQLVSMVCLETPRETTGKLYGNESAISFPFPAYRDGNMETAIPFMETTRETVWKQ